LNAPEHQLSYIQAIFPKPSDWEILISEVTPLSIARNRFPLCFFRLLTTLAAVALCTSSLVAQQTLGGITGEVTDASAE